MLLAAVPTLPAPGRSSGREDGRLASPIRPTTQLVVLAALTGACIWNLITWWSAFRRRPHALIGGLAGGVVGTPAPAPSSGGALGGKVLDAGRPPLIGFLCAFVLMIGLV